MPILDDMMDHDLLGPAIRQAKHQEPIAMLRRQITERFGPLTPTTEDRVGKFSTSELEDLGVRLLKATSLADLLERA